MDKRWIILALGTAALFVWWRSARASQTSSWQTGQQLVFDAATGQSYLVPLDTPDDALTPDLTGATDAPAPLWTLVPDTPYTPIQSAPMPANTADEYERRLAAFMATIRDFESNNDYAVLYGGGHFTDFSQHPNARVPFHNPRTGRNDYSTAAGAYQINYPTWTTEIQPALHLPDFSPQSQDIAARWLIEKRTRAAPLLASGDIAGAYRAASGKWASLPGSTAMQNAKPIDIALAQFNAYIGA